MTRLRLPWRRAASPRDLRCRELVELVTSYLEDRLPPAERVRVVAHLEACEHCSAYVEQMRVTLRVLGEIPPESLSPRAQAELLAAFRDFQTERGVQP